MTKQASSVEAEAEAEVRDEPRAGHAVEQWRLVQDPARHAVLFEKAPRIVRGWSIRLDSGLNHAQQAVVGPPMPVALAAEEKTAE